MDRQDYCVYFLVWRTNCPIACVACVAIAFSSKTPILTLLSRTHSNFLHCQLYQCLQHDPSLMWQEAIARGSKRVWWKYWKHKDLIVNDGHISDITIFYVGREEGKINVPKQNHNPIILQNCCSIHGYTPPRHWNPNWSHNNTSIN